MKIYPSFLSKKKYIKEETGDFRAWVPHDARKLIELKKKMTKRKARE